MDEVRESKRPKISNPFPLDDGIIFHLSNSNQLIINEGVGFNLSGSALVANENAVGFGKTLQFLGFGTIHVGHMGDGTSESTCIWRGKKIDGDQSDYAFLTFRFEKNLGKNKNKNVLTHVRENELFTSMTIDQSLKCTMCHQYFRAGRDVSTLITKEGLPFCQPVNKKGLFEVFHTSCLLHWLLFRVSKGQRPYCPICFGYGSDAMGVTRETFAKLHDEKIEIFQANQEWRRGSTGPTESIVPVSETGLKFTFTEQIKELRKSVPFYRAI